MDNTKGAKTEENNFATKLLNLESKNEANNIQNNTEPNCTKENLEKEEKIKKINCHNKNGEVSNTSKEKGKKKSIDFFESKEKNQEDIKIGPLQEMELQQSNNDSNINKVKAKKKINIKNKKIIKERPNWKKAKRLRKIKNTPKKCLFNNNRRHKAYMGKKRFKRKKPEKAKKAENTDLNDDNNGYLCNFDFPGNRLYDNNITPIYQWDEEGFNNINNQLFDDDEKFHLEKGMVESNHSPSVHLFNYGQFPTINYDDYDNALNSAEFVNENDNTNYKTEEDQ